MIRISKMIKYRALTSKETLELARYKAAKAAMVPKGWKVVLRNSVTALVKCEK